MCPGFRTTLAVLSVTVFRLLQLISKSCSWIFSQSLQTFVCRCVITKISASYIFASYANFRRFSKALFNYQGSFFNSLPQQQLVYITKSLSLCQQLFLFFSKKRLTSTGFDFFLTVFAVSSIIISNHSRNVNNKFINSLFF